MAKPLARVCLGASLRCVWPEGQVYLGAPWAGNGTWDSGQVARRHVTENKYTPGPEPKSWKLKTVQEAVRWKQTPRFLGPRVWKGIQAFFLFFFKGTLWSSEILLESTMHKTDQSKQGLKVQEGVALTSTGCPQITSENQTALWDMFGNHLYTLERPLDLESILCLALSNNLISVSFFFFSCDNEVVECECFYSSWKWVFLCSDILWHTTSYDGQILLGIIPS